MSLVEIGAETDSREIMFAVEKFESNRDEYYIIDAIPKDGMGDRINKRIIRKSLFDEHSRALVYRNNKNEIDGLILLQRSTLSVLSSYLVVLLIQPLRARPIVQYLSADDVENLSGNKLRCSSRVALPGIEEYCGFFLESECLLPTLSLFHYSYFLK